MPPPHTYTADPKVDVSSLLTDAAAAQETQHFFNVNWIFLPPDIPSNKHSHQNSIISLKKYVPSAVDGLS